MWIAHNSSTYFTGGRTMYLLLPDLEFEINQYLSCGLDWWLRVFESAMKRLMYSFVRTPNHQPKLPFVYETLAFQLCIVQERILRIHSVLAVNWAKAHTARLGVLKTGWLFNRRVRLCCWYKVAWFKMLQHTLLSCSKRNFSTLHQWKAAVLDAQSAVWERCQGPIGLLGRSRSWIPSSSKPGFSVGKVNEGQWTAVEIMPKSSVAWDGMRWTYAADIIKGGDMLQISPNGYECI